MFIKTREFAVAYAGAEHTYFSTQTTGCQVLINKVVAVPTKATDTHQVGDVLRAVGID